MKNVIAGLEEGLSAIAEALEGGGGSSIVPTPTAQDDGKVLTANDHGTASWETPQGGLPDISQANVGDVLAKGYNGDPEWSYVVDLLPNGSSALVPTTSGVTNGYVLTNTSGTPTWAAASGGGGGGGGASVNKEYKEVSASDFDISGTNYVACIVGLSGLSSALATALANDDITGIKLNASDTEVTYNGIDCIGWYIDDKSGDLYVYFRKSDYTILDKEDIRGVTFIYF